MRFVGGIKVGFQIILYFLRKYLDKFIQKEIFPKTIKYYPMTLGMATSRVVPKLREQSAYIQYYQY